MKATLTIKLAAAALFLIFAVNSRAQEAFETAEILYSQAILDYDAENYSEATRKLLKAHDLDPGHLDVIYYLGLSYNAQGNFTVAERYVRQGVALDPKNLDLRYVLGTSLYGQNRFDDALKEFLAIYQVQPQRDDVGYYIGLCYYQKKDYETATGYFRKNVSTDVKTRQLNQYYLGLALRQLGRETEAIEELTEVVKIEPASPIVGPTQQLLTALRERTGGKRLRLEVTFNAQYDSNPDGHTDERGSPGNLINARADYTLFRSGPWESTATYSFLQTLNYRNHRGDLTDNLLAADLNYKMLIAGMPAVTGVQLANDFLMVEGEKYLQRPTATFSFTLQENPVNFTTLLIRPQYKNFLQRGVTEKRTAVNHLVGLVHYFRFGEGKHQVNFGYHFDNEDAVSSDWTYIGHKAVAGLLLALPLGLQGTVNAEYHARNYSAQPILGGHRRDNEVTFLTSVSKDIVRNLTLTFQYLLDRNYSTTSDFDIARHVTALGLTWRY